MTLQSSMKSVLAVVFDPDCWPKISIVIVGWDIISVAKNLLSMHMCYCCVIVIIVILQNVYMHILMESDLFSKVNNEYGMKSNYHYVVEDMSRPLLQIR